MLTQPIATVEGVSEDLARHRRQILSDIAYQLEFTIPEKKEANIAAWERISFNWKKNATPLALDFKEQRDHIHRIVVNGKEVPIVFEEEHILIAPTNLKAGKNTVRIEFIAGNLSLNRNDGYLYTLLVPDRARTVFPCFDQPDLKATFKLSLIVPQDWRAVSNGPREEREGWTVYPPINALPDSLRSEILNFRRYDFKTTDLLPTYLFSFVAGKFERVTRSLNGREMSLYHRETDTSKIRLSLDPIFDTHAQALAFMEDYTQIRYPFQKFDFAAIPDFQYGGMEHAGAIQYKAASLFLDQGATRNQKLGRTKLLSHETAHMWFGDLVTMRWFNDVWMKEVFANFMADKIAKAAQPDSNFELEFLLSHFPAAYGVDRTEGPNAIGQPLENLNQAGTLYGPIIYHKAPIMMRQLERLMGPDALRDGLREYLKKYAYGNATWPDLIAILDPHTPADLAAWNRVWVNETGRPDFRYSMKEEGGKIKELTITQDGEDGTERVWPQFFEIALGYPDHVVELTVPMSAASVTLSEAAGLPMPDYILFNSSGQGYGLFPVDQGLLRKVPDVSSPLMRASAYISLYENMLNKSAGITPALLADVLVKMLEKETEELSLDLISDQLSTIYWQFFAPAKRVGWSEYLEGKVWTTMNQIADANKKKVLFKLYQNIALGESAQARIYEIWKDQKAPAGVTLTEDDYTSLALALAVRDYPVGGILEKQLARIKNPDRQKRLRFMMPALSAEAGVRDAFFASLKEEENRDREAWVAAALGYLHHPLRAATSQRYLRESLDLLEEIQRTGDIFFPSAWLNATLGSYQSPEAERVVRDFLEQHPNYNHRLKAKLLQAADNLFRAERIVD
jgi:aminopeptidase N